MVPYVYVIIIRLVLWLYGKKKKMSLTLQTDQIIWSAMTLFFVVMMNSVSLGGHI